MTYGKVLPLHRVHGTVDEMSDRALVAAVADGDQAALGALYDRFHRDVYRFVARLSRSDVDDLVQSTFIEAYRSARRYRGDSTVKTWLFGIGANLTRHHHRSEARRRNATTNLSTVPGAAPATPSETIGIEYQRRLLAAAVEMLTPALKEVYVLCVIEEVPGKAAAEVLGIREASLWRRLTDARNALRATIEAMQQ